MTLVYNRTEVAFRPRLDHVTFDTYLFRLCLACPTLSNLICRHSLCNINLATLGMEQDGSGPGFITRHDNYLPVTTRPGPPLPIRRSAPCLTIPLSALPVPVSSPRSGATVSLVMGVRVPRSFPEHPLETWLLSVLSVPTGAPIRLAPLHHREPKSQPPAPRGISPRDPSCRIPCGEPS